MWKLAALLGLIGSPGIASIHRCGEWPDAGLRQRGEVIISLEETSLTWRSDSHERTAELVRGAPGFAVFADDNYIYMVFGLLWIGDIPNTIETVRRLGMSRNSDVVAITCE